MTKDNVQEITMLTLTPKEAELVQDFAAKYEGLFNEITLCRSTSLINLDHPETEDVIVSIHLWDRYRTVAVLEVNTVYNKNYSFDCLKENFMYSIKTEGTNTSNYDK